MLFPGVSCKFVIKLAESSYLVLLKEMNIMSKTLYDVLDAGVVGFYVVSWRFTGTYYPGAFDVC